MPLRPRHREQSQLWDRQGSSDNPRPDRRAKVELRSNGHKFYGGGCGITTGEERVADWKILVHHGRHERSFRDELSPHLVFTKNDTAGEWLNSRQVARSIFEKPRSASWQVVSA
jgi:hypothetical protein